MVERRHCAQDAHYGGKIAKNTVPNTSALQVIKKQRKSANLIGQRSV